MKAIICNKPFDLAVEERATPQPGYDEVLIKITRVGICGTDFHIFSGNQPYLDYPRVMGHELAGEVAEVRPQSHLTEGQRVTINPYLSCGGCVACRRGKPNCCVDIRVMGVHVDGGMAEFVCVPELAVVPVDGLSSDQAAMIEFLSIGAHAVRRGSVTDADQVLVVGAGPIGIATALFAKLAGAEVSLIDVSEQRLIRARDTLGIADVHIVNGALTPWLEARTGGDYFDVVFDATGNATAMEKGFYYVAHGGRYVLVSVVKQDITFSDPEFHKREMQLISSRNATRHDFQLVIDMIRDGAIPTEALQTHSFDLIDLPEIVPDLARDIGSVLKAIGRL